MGRENEGLSSPPRERRRWRARRAAKANRLLTPRPTARPPKGRPAAARRVLDEPRSCSWIENSIAGSSTSGPRPNSQSPGSNARRLESGLQRGWINNFVAGTTKLRRRPTRGRSKKGPEWRAPPNTVAKAAAGKGALERAKAPGTERADAFDEATDARGPRPRDPATDRGVTMVPEASPPSAAGAEQAPERKATPPKGSRGSYPKDEASRSPPNRAEPGNRRGTAERSTPILLERAGEIAVNQGECRSERPGVNRVLLPSKGESNDPQGARKSGGLQKSMGRIHRGSLGRSKGRTTPR